MKKDPKLTVADAVSGIRDMIDPNFDLIAEIDRPFITQVLKALGLRDADAHFAQVAAALFAKHFLVRQEYPKLLYQLRNDGTMRRHRVDDAAEEKAMSSNPKTAGTWYASPKAAEDAADKSKPKNK